MFTGNIPRFRLVLSLALLSALLVGLRFASNSPVAAQQEDANRMAARTPAATAAPVKTLDDMFADVSRLVPSFGGCFIDDNGRLNVYLLNRAHLPEAMQAITAVFGRDEFPSESPIALQARYSFLQLKLWHDAHQRNTLKTPGVSFVDIDEVNNRLEIGVINFNAAMEVRALLHRLGISEEAAHISEVEGFKMHQSLQSKHRPIAGGIQIGNLGGNCTLGFLATVNKEAGFVTNSHCTSNFGVNNSDAIKQPNNNVANTIGVELFDPPLFSNGACPSGRLCRYSDAAFIARDAGATQPNPLIGGDFGYLLLANDPMADVPVKYRISSRAKFTLAGTTVEKVGRSTGRTKGKVTATCTNMNQLDGDSNDTGRTMLCQNVAAANSAPGDSGSPVFTLETFPGGSTGVRLHGIHWGGDGQQIVYSPLSQVASEIVFSGGGIMSVYAGDNPTSTPMVKIRKPANNATVGLGGFNMVNFEAEAVDYEDDNLQFTWTSSVDGLIGFGQNVQFTFNSSGQRTITVTVTDGEGLTRKDSITVKVAANTAPSVKITYPTHNQQLSAGVTYNFTGTATDQEEPGGVLPCSSLAWTSQKVGTATVVPMGNGCGIPAKFLNTGDYVIKLKGTDSQGGVGTTSITIKVVEAPASGPPVVTMLFPIGNELLYSDQPVTLKGYATDPDGKNPLTYQWAIDDGYNYKVVKTGTVNNGQLISFSWQPDQTHPHSCKTYAVKIWLIVTDADGEKGQVMRIVTVSYGPC